MQVVGSPCGVCGAAFRTVRDIDVCPRCLVAFHRTCKPGDECPRCDADTVAAQGFVPPQASDSQPAPPFKHGAGAPSSPRRPFRVMLLSAAWALLAFLGGRYVLQQWPPLERPVPAGRELGHGLQLAMVALMAGVTVGIFRGRNWARWTALALVVLAICFKDGKEKPPADANERWEDEMANAAAGCILLLTALPLFTPAANRYFAAQSRES